MRGRTIATIIVAAVIAGGAYAAFKDDIAQLRDNLHVKLAEYPQPKKTIWLEQNVDRDRLGWFYHEDQGTRTFGIPYEWFIALEQPTIPWLVFTSVDLFREQSYLDRYGFIPDTPVTGKIVLPIGFAYDKTGNAMLDSSGAPWRNPRSKANMTGFGLTCAACHTGRFTYKDTAVIVDGGPALTDLLKLKQGIAVALLYTRYLPGRFGRFADRVLGEDSTVAERETLKYQLGQVLQQFNEVKQLEQRVATQSIEEGYGRLDALNRIGNQVFALDLKRPENYAGSSAPVHFPRIWNTPWFDWVQYNGSIMQPMVRNAGESLGVSSELNLTDPSKELFKSSVNVEHLYKMEQMVAGKAPTKDGFSGLSSPKWPEDILGKIDRKLADTGRELYREHCQECHRAPVSDKAAFFNFEDKKSWRTNQIGEPVLLIENIPIEHIGTDPAQAADMRHRRVALPSNLGIEETKFAAALKEVVERTVDYIYYKRKPPITDVDYQDQQPISDEDKQRINGYMPNEIQDDLAYKVRPLNGVWATPPYLHNGSVPTVYDLLSPVDERPKQFYLGNREYDPVKLGYKTDELANGFLLDTTIRGNANTGHEFADKKTKGVIGKRKLEPDERKAIIEFLKTQ